MSTDLELDDVVAIAARLKGIVPKRLALSRETFLALSKTWLIQDGPRTRLCGIPIEFDQSVPAGKFRAIYSDQR